MRRARAGLLARLPAASDRGAACLFRRGSLSPRRARAAGAGRIHQSRTPAAGQGADRAGHRAVRRQSRRLAAAAHAAGHAGAVRRHARAVVRQRKPLRHACLWRAAGNRFPPVRARAHRHARHLLPGLPRAGRMAVRRRDPPARTGPLAAGADRRGAGAGDGREMERAGRRHGAGAHLPCRARAGSS